MILRQYWRREARGLLGWAVVLALLVQPLVGMYRLMMNSDSMREIQRMIDQLPAAIQSMIGGGLQLNTLDAWLQAEVFGIVIPLAVLVYTALASLGVLTREMDSRTMDFLLSLPVRRSQVVLGRLTGLALNLLLLHVALWGSVGLAVTFIGETPNWTTYALVLANQWLIFVALAGLLVLLTVWVDDYQKGLMATVGVGLALFFLPHLIVPDTPVSWLRSLSLFHYYQPAEVLRSGSLPTLDVAVLAGVAAVATGLAVWLFERKQLTA
jgi:ABC-2 type transport system permease protein